jgi:hypothetical protein
MRAHMQVQKLKVQSAASQVGKKAERAKFSQPGRQKYERDTHESLLLQEHSRVMVTWAIQKFGEQL